MLYKIKGYIDVVHNYFSFIVKFEYWNHNVIHPKHIIYTTLCLLIDAVICSNERTNLKPQTKWQVID